MPLSTPMEVMPTCTVERNWVGCSSSRSAMAAPLSPASARHARRALRLEASASSDIANTPLSTVSSAISKKSMAHGGRMGTMGLYLIGDVQGCDDALARLLDEVAFSPAATNWCCWATWSTAGPIRPACCAGVAAFDGAAACLLGNHDLSLLAVAQRRARKSGRKATRWTACSTRPTAKRCSTGCAGSRWRCTRPSAC
jgi:hypothetical protein